MGCLGNGAIEVKNEENKNEKDKKETIINEPSKININKHSSDIKNEEDKKKESGGDKIAVKMIKINNNDNKQNDKNEEEKKLIISKVKNAELQQQDKFNLIKLEPFNLL